LRPLRIAEKREPGTKPWARAKPLVDDGLVGLAGLRQSTHPEMQAIEKRLAQVGQRDELTARRLAKVRDVEERELGDARIHGSDAGDFRDALDQRLRRPGNGGKDVGEAIALVIGDAGLLERAIGSDCHDQRRHRAGDDQGDRQRLGP
jgi:hypothetical protein